MGAAGVGNVETTTKPDPYLHPSNPKITFWDVPGIGTPNYPNIKVYRKAIDLQKYDAYLFFARGPFSDHDLELAKEANSMKKPFFFIRAHVDTELRNATKSKGPKYEENDTLEEMKNDCLKKLQGLFTSESDVFLIDNYSPEKWEFDRLLAAIDDELPERKRVCFTLSLSNVTRNCLKRKAKMLRGKQYRYPIRTN